MAVAEGWKSHREADGGRTVAEEGTHDLAANARGEQEHAARNHVGGIIAPHRFF